MGAEIYLESSGTCRDPSWRPLTFEAHLAPSVCGDEGGLLARPPGKSCTAACFYFINLCDSGGGGAASVGGVTFRTPDLGDISPVASGLVAPVFWGFFLA